jgi:signal recognition particle receptor subunit beta
MALFNHATKELTAKIVFYGPGLCGKTTNLKILHQRLERGAGKLLSLSTAQDRTIYFDLLPIELGNIKGYTVRFQVCTVPGQVFYNETRKIVLRGVDGLVFVVDSQWSMLSHNLESFQNLRENLADEKIPLESLPVVIQYNKRDLPSALSVEALQESLGFQSYPYVEAVASEGMGVLETFKLASKLTFVDLLRRLQRGWKPPVDVDVPAAESSLGSSSLGSSSGPGASTRPFTGPGPAVTISAPAPEPEETPAAAPVLAMAGAESTSASEEEPAEWVPPSAEGTFADLSDDSQKKVAPGARPDAAASVPPAPAARPESLSAVAGSSTSGERPRSLRPETTAPVTPLDDKLNAVLAEARRAAAGRGSGTFRRDDAAPEAGRPDTRRLEALEKALEKALEAEREERRQLAADLERTVEKAVEAERDERSRLAANLEQRLEAEKEAHAAAALKTGETLEGLGSGVAAAASRADEALAAIAALKAEAEDHRSGLAGAIAAERAARESAEASAGEAAISLAAQVAGLTERLQAAQAAAEASHAAAAAALERARRLEDALRAALRDLTS